MNKCSECRYFDTNSFLGADWGNCSWIDDEGKRGQLARAWDYEGYSAGLYVSAEFGCIQWASKESA